MNKKIWPVLIIALPFLLLTAFRPNAINGPAMEPTYKNGTKFISFKYPYINSNPSRGDIIVFQYAAYPSYEFVERIIGLPGETVKIQNGQVYVNNQILNEPYISNDVKTSAMAKVDLMNIDKNTGKFVEDPNNPIMIEGQEINISKSSYFVLGDNRSNSYDSRSLGLVRRTDIQSKLLFTY